MNKIFAIIFILLSIWACNRSEKKDDLPNIILVMADDLGYGDLACYGNETIKTPHLDAMAEAGIRFERFYSAAPVCSPTRGSCLTGRHPYRYNMPWAGRYGMPAEEITLAEALKTKGYATGHFGKWHVGGLSKTINQTEFPGGPSPYSPPWENGFDECFSTESMMPTYNPYYHVGGAYGTEAYRFVQNVPVGRGQYKGGFPWRDYYWTGENEFLKQAPEGDDSKIIMDKALDFIERKAAESNPFLSVIWFHTPHTPVVAGNQHRALYPDQEMEAQHWYGSISAMDEQIGELRQKLRELDIEENTVVWFCSDNGPSYIHQHNSSGGLRGKKAELYEGGIRVPAILEWPQRVSTPLLSKLPVSTSDFYPVFLSLCGIEMDDQPLLDGENVIHNILSGKSDRDNPILFQSPVPNRLKKYETADAEQFALIDNNLKLVSIDNGATFQLYDLNDDPGEKNDISKEYKELMQKLILKLEAWQVSIKNSAGGKDYLSQSIRN